MAVASIADLHRGAVAGRASSARASTAPTQELYVQLLRINCFAQILFAASFALGEILVAHRRFVFYAIAPIFYTGGIILGTVLFAEPLRDRGHGLGRGRRRGGPPGDPGDRHDADVVPDPAGVRDPDRRVRRVHPADDPADVSVPIEPLTLTYFTRVAAGLAAGSVAALNFGLDFQVLPVSLIGVVVLAGGLPRAVGRLRRPRRSRVPERPRSQPGDDRGADLARGGGPVRAGRAARRRAPRRRPVRTRRRRADDRGRRRVRAVDPVRRARLPAVARAVRDPRHAPPGHRLVHRARRRRSSPPRR